MICIDLGRHAEGRKVTSKRDVVHEPIHIPLRTTFRGGAGSAWLAGVRNGERATAVAMGGEGGSLSVTVPWVLIMVVVM